MYSFKRFMPVYGFFVLLFFFLFFLAASTAAAQEPVAAGKIPLDDNGHMRISQGDRCPVCAMKVGKHKKFASAIQMVDGTTFYFCGTGCMIRSWIHPEAFLGKKKEALKRGVVQDYFTGRQVDAMNVFWVAGSDIVGPMGPALVPLRSVEDLEAFKKRHGGKAVFRLSEMDDGKWLKITGKSILKGK